MFEICWCTGIVKCVIPCVVVLWWSGNAHFKTNVLYLNFTVINGLSYVTFGSRVKGYRMLCRQELETFWHFCHDGLLYKFSVFIGGVSHV